MAGRVTVDSISGEHVEKADATAIYNALNTAMEVERACFEKHDWMKKKLQHGPEFVLCSQMHPGCLSISLQLGRLQNRCVYLIYNYLFSCSHTRLLHSAIDFSDSSRNMHSNLEDDEAGIFAPTNRS